MANDRMAIVCGKCNEGISIAKYYPIGSFIAGPESGWGHYPLNERRMGQFFVKHSHRFDCGGVSGKQFFLGYESDGKGWRYFDK
jgi:hypothetical protein